MTDLAEAVIAGIVERGRLEHWIRAEHQLRQRRGRRRAVERELGERWVALVGRGGDLSHEQAIERAYAKTGQYETLDEVRGALEQEAGGRSRTWVIAALSRRQNELRQADTTDERQEAVADV